ncbi:MAG: hypothetical protein HYT20_03095 [Candidatus Nealsonbacteria bacterium]|nr:hypothetical protein [Candidatus Nealsonbacteria bacterium]
MISPAITQSISEKAYFIHLPKISLRKILISGFILIALLLAFCIFQINEVIKAASLVSMYEQEIVLADQQSKDMEASLYQEKSLSNLEVALSSFNYEKVRKIYYIQVIDNQVVVNAGL